MKAVIPKSKRPLPNTPWRLYGSFNPGLKKNSDLVVIEEFLRRAELTADPQQRLMQAQRVIGALMALLALNTPDSGSSTIHVEVFARLSALTGETPDSLVIMAGFAI